jgi:hyperosmotically inducible periplasmic protein
MYTKSRKLILASAITLALASISGSSFADTVSNDVTEARQESQIWTTYSLSPYLRANDLKVSVDNGTATLTGTVEEDVNKDLAKQIALGVNGIKEVDNQIKVEPDYVSPARTSEERSFGEVVDDASITATVKSKLLWGKNTDGMEVDVDTRMGTVTLNGSADNGASRELAGRMAENTRGVVSVDNKLVVNEAQPASNVKVEPAEGDTSEAIADTWITTKVKSTFMYSSNVENDDISVSTEDGNVTLTGMVGSGAERELATELAMNVRGVKSVNAEDLKF